MSRLHSRMRPLSWVPLSAPRFDAAPVALSVLRTGLGAVMIARPRTLPRALGVDAATATRTSWLVRMVGFREIALGAGTVMARRRRERTASWLLGQALADCGDAVGVAIALRRGQVAPRPAVIFIAVASGGALVGLGSAISRRGQSTKGVPQ